MAMNSKCCAEEEDEIIQDIKTSLSQIIALKDADNISLQPVLLNAEKLLKINKESLITDPRLDDISEYVIKILFEFLKIKSERCRELSVKILCHLGDSKSRIQHFVPFISTVLFHRLTKSDQRESSEEVRLLEVQLLQKIIENYDGDLLKYMNDIANILCVCITDGYSDVKRKSCECTILLAQKEDRNFHMISSAVLKPLLKTVSHQHFKTRAICVKAIGHVVCSGSSQNFEDAVTHVAQRLFDHSPFVRSSVAEVIGCWLLMLTDRYSYFNRLIPLMLSTLHDEVHDIRLKGNDLWNKAGEQYLNENEKDYKDLMDFPPPEPENYPSKAKRPSLGCRILVQRNIYNILPALIRDLTDWVLDTRKKCVQVLYSLILHVEDKATMQLTSFIEGIVVASKDDEKEVHKMALQCAEMLGFFLNPDLLCDTVMTLVHKSASAVHLSIFAAVLRGNKNGLSPKCFQAICKLLSESYICRLRQAEEQANLLLCIEGILISRNNIDCIESYQLFTILCTVSGLTTNNSVSEKALSLLNQIANIQSLSMESLFKMHSLSLIKNLITNNELWTSENPELPIFCYILQSEYANEDILKAALPVMTTNLNLNKDIKLRARLFTLLAEVFKKFPSIHDNELSEEIFNLIKLGVFPNLSWSPGKAAGSLRMIAVASFYEIVRQNCISNSMLKSMCNEVLPALSSLADDDEVTNRLLSCKILTLFLPKLFNCIDDIKIHSVCHDFLQCLDDGSDDIRIAATKLLKAYVQAFPKNYSWNSYRSYLKEIYENVLIHMDDKNQKVKESVLDLLKDTAFANPQLLLDEIEKKRYMMASGDYCDDLLEHIKKLHV